MKIFYTRHACERMKKYGISRFMVEKCLAGPDSKVGSYEGRSVYQMKLNGLVLRVVVYEEKEIKTVITTYKARSNRYGI